MMQSRAFVRKLVRLVWLSLVWAGQCLAGIVRGIFSGSTQKEDLSYLQTSQFTEELYKKSGISPSDPHDPLYPFSSSIDDDTFNH